MATGAPAHGTTAADEDPGEGQGSERRCIVTGRVGPKAELLRFVVSPDGEVVPDVGARLPGRGIWLCARRDVVNTAVAKRSFAKAARRPVAVPVDLAERVEGLLVRRCLDAIGLARRAGQAVCGFEKVKAELKAGRVAVVVEACDGAADGRDKMRGLAAGLPVVDVFDAEELGGVFGRDAAVHVALAAGGLAERLKVEAGLLAGFRGGIKDHGTDRGRGDAVIETECGGRTADGAQ